MEWEISYRRAIRSDNAVFRMKIHGKIYTCGFQEDRRVAIKLALAEKSNLLARYNAIHRYFKTKMNEARRGRSA